MHPAITKAPDARKSPFNAVLRVQTTRAEAAQKAVIPILDANTKKWQIAEVIHAEDGSSIVEFDVRLKKSTDLAAFIKEIEEGEENVGKVELRKHKKKT